MTRWLFIILIPILLLSGTIAWAFNSLWIYENGFMKYDVGQALGISSAQLNISASKLIAYFNDPHQQYLDINITYDNNVTGPLYDQADILHMKAVKNLIWVDYGLLLFAAIYSLAYILANAIWNKRNRRRDIGLGAAWGGGLTVAVICFLGIFVRDQLQLIFYHLPRDILSGRQLAVPARRPYDNALSGRFLVEHHNTGGRSSASAGYPGLVCRFCIVAI